jgi:hypothetical protein
LIIYWKRLLKKSSKCPRCGLWFGLILLILPSYFKVLTYFPAHIFCMSDFTIFLLIILSNLPAEMADYLIRLYSELMWIKRWTLEKSILELVLWTC